MAHQLPAIPPTAFSHLGPLPVCLLDGMADREGALGKWQEGERRILLDPKTQQVAQWATFWHEIGHVVMWDGAVSQQLSIKQQEAVCDALGTYMAAAMQAGFITVHPLTP